MPDDFSQLVKAQADIVKVVGDHVRLRKAGAQNWTGLCPFHSEKSGVVFRPCFAAVLSLLRLRGFGRRVYVRAAD